MFDCVEWVPRLPTENVKRVSYGVDFGYTNDQTTIVKTVLSQGKLYSELLLYQTGLTNQQISQEFERLGIRRGRRSGDIIMCDSAEPKSIAELRTLGHKVLPCTKGKDSIVYGINLINQNKIYVISRSKNLIKELQSYTWMKDREGNTINKPIDAFNHCIDAARYAITSQLQTPNKGKYNIR